MRTALTPRASDEVRQGLHRRLTRDLLDVRQPRLHAGRLAQTRLANGKLDIGVRVVEGLHGRDERPRFAGVVVLQNQEHHGQRWLSRTISWEWDGKGTHRCQ